MTFAELADHIAAKHGANDLVLTMIAKVKTGKLGTTDTLLVRHPMTVDSAVLSLRQVVGRGRILKVAYATEDLRHDIKTLWIESNGGTDAAND